MARVAEPVQPGRLGRAIALGDAQQDAGQLGHGVGPAAGHVVDTGRQRAERQHVGSRHIVDVDEVPQLVPVLEEHDRPVQRQPQGKNAQRAVVGILKRLPAPVHHSVAEHDGLDPMAGTNQPGDLLLGQLAQSVDATRAGGRLVRRQRRQRATAARAYRLPGAAVQRLGLPRIREDLPVLGAAISAFAVDRQAGAHYQPPDQRLAVHQELAQQGGAHRVDLEQFAEGGQVIVVIGQVQDHLGALQGGHPVVAIPNVALDQANAGGQFRDGGVPGRRQVVEHGHLVPLLGQAQGRPRPDEPGSPADQDFQLAK